MPIRRAPNKATPTVDLAAGTVTVPAPDAGAAQVLRLDTPFFYLWLASVKKFYVTGGTVTFSCRHNKGARGIYWQAYRTVDGAKLTRYLGKDAQVTAQSLKAAADALMLTST